MAGILCAQNYSLYRRAVVNSLIKISSSAKNCNRGNYIVLLPEIPPDTPETNPLLQSDYVPDFSKLSTSSYVNAIGKLAIEYESGICRIEEGLENGDTPLNLENVIKPIEILSAPLDFAFSNMNTFSKVINNGQLKETVSKLQTRVVKSKSSRYSSLTIFNAMKEINTQTTLSESEKRVTEKYLLESRLNGIELTGYNKGHYENAVKNLASHKDYYRKKLEISSSRFKHTLSHSSLVQNFPPNLLKKMASNRHFPSQGPWNVTLDPPVYKGFMENCSDRMLRWNVWQAYVSRASSTDSELNNSIHIEEIRFNRRDFAKLLGYDSFADFSMETKMAGSVETVKSLITSLHLKSKAIIEKELLDLQDFALQNGFNGQLELWDVPYWKNQQNKALFSLDDYEISQYFPLVNVLDGLFKFCKDLFGIEIKDASNQVPLWHKDVKYFEVYGEDGKFKGSFFFDAFQRPGVKLHGTSLDISRTKNESAGVHPLSYLILDLPSPLAEQKSVLTFQELTSLFKTFGHLLQVTLSEVPYSDVSGLNNIEWDAVEVLPFFMELWLTDYQTIAKISSHVKTGEPLPKQIHNQIKMSRNHMSGYELNNELYLSALDLELYSRKDYWMDITRNVWAEYIPFQLDTKDSHPCSFREIFCDQFPASYYCHKWAEMIAADAFGGFYEVGLSNQSEIQQVGRRFRDTFLSLGGGCSSSEVFRRFRGRDPSLEALLVSRGLKKLKMVPQDDV